MKTIEKIDWSVIKTNLTYEDHEKLSGGLTYTQLIYELVTKVNELIKAHNADNGDD